jgi:hypothetical protein
MSWSQRDFAIAFLVGCLCGAAVFVVGMVAFTSGDDEQQARITDELREWEAERQRREAEAEAALRELEAEAARRMQRADESIKGRDAAHERDLEAREWEFHDTFLYLDGKWRYAPLLGSVGPPFPNHRK